MKFALIAVVLVISCLWEVDGLLIQKKSLAAVKKTAAKAANDIKLAKHNLHKVLLTSPPNPSAPKVFAKLAAAQKELKKVKLVAKQTAKAVSNHHHLLAKQAG